MSRGYRSTLIAVGLILGCEAKAQDTIGPPADSPTVQQGSQEEADQASDTAERFPLPIRIVEHPKERERAERREQDVAAREKRDLAAQESMARSTEEIVVISWWHVGLAALGTFVAIVGTGAILYSLKLTRDATKAAIQAVQTERAWISFNGVKTFTDGDDIGFAVEWTNSGRSPALDVQTYIASDILNRGDMEILTFDRPQPKIIHKSTPFGPGMNKATNVCTLRQRDFSLWVNGDIRLIIYSFVGYRDFYSDESRHTEFCGEIEYISETVAPDGRLNIETYIHPHGHQNTGS